MVLKATLKKPTPLTARIRLNTFAAPFLESQYLVKIKNKKGIKYFGVDNIY